MLTIVVVRDGVVYTLDYTPTLQKLIQGAKKEIGTSPTKKVKKPYDPHFTHRAVPKGWTVEKYNRDLERYNKANWPKTFELERVLDSVSEGGAMGKQRNETTLLEFDGPVVMLFVFCPEW